MKEDQIPLGARVSGILVFQPDYGDQLRGDRVHGWAASVPKADPQIDPSGSLAAVVEADPKYGRLHDGMIPDADYVQHRKREHFVYLKEVRPIRHWQRGVPHTNYKLHKARKKGSIQIGKVWITPSQDDGNVLE